MAEIQWLIIPEPPATLLGVATWRIQCHDTTATYHIAGCYYYYYYYYYYKCHGLQCCHHTAAGALYKI